MYRDTLFRPPKPYIHKHLASCFVMHRLFRNHLAAFAFRSRVVFFALIFGPLLTFAQPDTAQVQNYFYKGYDYGSQALHNPLSLFWNRGFDIFQMRGTERHIANFDYNRNASRLFSDLAHPFGAISTYGWGKFVSREILPLTFDSEEARWLPNYTLHLFGGGMTYVSLHEWFDYHNIRHGKIWAGTAVMFYAFLNETLEASSIEGRNTDAIADIYLFDIGGIIMFSFPGVNRFFSETLHWADWSGMASFVYPSGRLHNNGQHFVIKYQPGFSKRWMFFAHMGLNGLGGVSYRLDPQRTISFGGGFRSANFVLASDSSKLSTVKIVPSAGLFFDRNNSLMASLIVSDSDEYTVQLNLYPGIVHLGRFSPGLWAVASRRGELMLGISARHTLGTGVGYFKME